MAETIYRKLKDLKKLPNNPRTILDDDFKRLCDSVQNNSDYFKARPLILSDRTGELVIIAGNQRYEAAKRLKLREVPTHLIENLTEEREREIIIRDNVANGSWDFELLDSGDWDLQDLTDWGVTMPDFEAIEDAGEPQDADAQIDKAAELNEKWKVCKGDLFSIGSHRLLCGDSTKREDVERLMDGKKAQMLFTDPPYNVAFKGQELSNTTKNGKMILHQKTANTKHNPIVNDNLEDNDFISWFYIVLANTEAVLNGGWYICFCDLKLDLLLKPLKQKGWKWKSIIVWMKNQATLSAKDYKSRYEPIVYGCPENSFFGERYLQEDIWEIQRTLKNDLHPTMKPIDLAQKAILNSSKTNDIVIDFFGGSGSTMVASENKNRKAYLCEISENYCAVILQRMTDAFPNLEIKRISQSEAANG